MKRIIYIILFLLICLPVSATTTDVVNEETLRIGVLAKRGYEKAIEEWGSTAVYLSENIDGYRFEIIPVGFDDIYSKVEKKEIDFILCNSAIYIELETSYNIRSIVTMKNSVDDYLFKEFGGVIVANKNSDINTIEDLKNKKIGAVGENSLGGWLMQLRELKKNDIKRDDLSDIVFLNNQDDVIYYLQDEKIDSGFIRTDILERMQKEEKIDINDFKIINNLKDQLDFPLEVSTRLYPEWPFSVLKHIDDNIAEKVALHLLKTEINSKHAIDAKNGGWTIALSYQPVRDLYKDLELGSYKKYEDTNIYSFIKQNPKEFYGIGLGVVFLIFFIIFIVNLYRLSKRDKKRFSSILNFLPAIIFVTDKHGNIRLWNKKAEQILGYKKEEVLYKKERIIPKKFKNDTHLIVNTKKGEEKYVKKMSYFLAEGETLEMLIDETDDKKKEYESKKQTSELSDQRMAILNILEDVEEEKDIVKELAKDLEKFKLAVEEASDHIIITDPEGIVLYTNKSVKNITGYKKVELIGKKAGIKDNWGGEMKLEIYKELWDTIKKKKKVYTGVLQNKRKNGEIYDVKASISPILNKNKEVLFFVGIERDITKEMEIDKAKTEFVSLASHQLRTPLTAINWYSEMLLAGDVGKITKEQKEYIEEIYNGNQRMVSLVNSLLNVSRLELGTFVVTPKDINFSKLVDSIAKELQPRINKKKLKFKKTCIKNLPTIKADLELTGIIVQNLLSNAVKYTPEKGNINVDIKKDTKFLIFKVKDTGLGIPEAQQDKVFSKLFRADNVKQSDTTGTGLGLYIIKSILDNIGGEISFESVENKGTEFIVKIPLKGMKKKQGTKKLTHKIKYDQ